MTKYVTKHCLFCGENEKPRQLYGRTFADGDLTPEVFSARRATEHFHYAIERCENCGLVFSREILPDDILGHLYAQSKVTFAEYTDVIRRDYWRCLEPFMEGRTKGSALEIGCSNGFFLEELLARGFKQVYGCEPSVEAKEMAHASVRNNIASTFFKGGMYEKGSFDLVCSFQTLDHLNDPLAVVREVHKILKPTGLAYFITHNVDALQARLLGEKSPIIDVEHIYLFNRQTLRLLLERAGFQVLTVSSVINSYPLDYWLRMFPLPAWTKSVLRKTTVALGLGTMPLPLRAGNVFIVAQRER